MKTVAPPPVTDVEFLEEALEDAQERAAEEKGVAGVQAAKLVIQIKGQLDHARAAAKLGDRPELDDIPEEEFLERLRVQAEETPDPYLEVFVRVFCERRGLRLVAADEVVAAG